MAQNVRSHPSRVRGLKSEGKRPVVYTLVVAPLAGAWIEIDSKLGGNMLACRTLRGCVD